MVWHIGKAIAILLLLAIAQGKFHSAIMFETTLGMPLTAWEFIDHRLALDW
jgi:hypothetical protein